MQTFGLLLLSSDVASWLRMFNPLLGLQTWYSLLGQPFKLWLGSILFYPLVELVYSWPAYLIGGILYFVISKYLNIRSRTWAILLGSFVGFAIYFMYACITGEWVLQNTGLVAEQLLIYTVAGAFYGWAYYFFIIRRIRYL